MKGNILWCLKWGERRSGGEKESEKGREESRERKKDKSERKRMNTGRGAWVRRWPVRSEVF